MEIAHMPILSKKEKDSEICSCQKGLKNSRNKIFTVCEFCSEKKFMKRTSSGSLVSSNSDSFGDEIIY